MATTRTSTPPQIRYEPTCIGRDVFAFKSLVGVGDGKSGHLTTKGLHSRFLAGLEDGGEARVLRRDEHTTAAMLSEEVAFVASVRNDEPSVRFEIDTTTTMILLRDGTFAVHSPAVLTDAVRANVMATLAGRPVSALIAPNLQHWLGVEAWAEAFPEARIYCAPPAHGEDLVDKLPSALDRDRVTTLCHPGGGGPPSAPGSICGGEIHYRLLDGASLMLNEVAFFHEKSSILLLSDGFYPGYDGAEPPNAFSRVWFKMTKGHWTSGALPSYRTSRVDDPAALVRSLEAMVAAWKPGALVCAHGSRVPFTRDPGAALVSAWGVTLPEAPEGTAEKEERRSTSAMG